MTDHQDSGSITSEKSERKRNKGATAKFVSKLSPKNDLKKNNVKTALLKVCGVNLAFGSP